MCNYSQGHCSFTATMSYSQMRTKTGRPVPVELAYSRTQSPVCRCFQDLEKLCIAQTTAWTFESTLHRLPSYASDLRGFLCFRDVDQHRREVRVTPLPTRLDLVSPHERDPRLFALTGMQGSFQLQEVPGFFRPRDKQCH